MCGMYRPEYEGSCHLTAAGAAVCEKPAVAAVVELLTASPVLSLDIPHVLLLSASASSNC
jgi:hypothetical protein